MRGTLRGLRVCIPTVSSLYWCVLPECQPWSSRLAVGSPEPFALAFFDPGYRRWQDNLSRMKTLASDQRTFFFSFKAKPTGPQHYQPPLWLYWPHAERAEPTGPCRQLLALPGPDLSPLEIFIVITLAFHHDRALGYVAGS